MTTTTLTVQQAYGRELIFISAILRDGSGTYPCNPDKMKFLENELFIMNRLSLTQDTWIASGFNSYVVKLK